MVKHTLNGNYFNEIDSEEKAYWLGFIQADGCIYKQGASYRFQMNLSGKDKEHLEKFKSCIEASYPVNTKTVRVKGKDYESSFIRVDSKEFCENLMLNGIFPRKTLNDSFPELEESLMRHYVRGFFDGDGGVKLDKRGNNPTRARMSFTGGEEYLTLLKEHLEMNGIIPSEKAIEKNSKSSACMLSYSSMKNNSMIYSYLYRDASIFLERKKEQLDAMMNRYMSRLVATQGQ